MRFSIIIPIYKTEKYLNQCVDSIIEQSFADFELILVDDGSPDNCPAICDEMRIALKSHPYEYSIEWNYKNIGKKLLLKK